MSRADRGAYIVRASWGGTTGRSQASTPGRRSRRVAGESASRGSLLSDPLQFGRDGAHRPNIEEENGRFHCHRPPHEPELADRVIREPSQAFSDPEETERDRQGEGEGARRTHPPACQLRGGRPAERGEAQRELREAAEGGEVAEVKEDVLGHFAPAPRMNSSPFPFL